jgi:hypothetical protein
MYKQSGDSNKKAVGLPKSDSEEREDILCGIGEKKKKNPDDKFTPKSKPQAMRRPQLSGIIEESAPAPSTEQNTADVNATPTSSENVVITEETMIGKGFNP